MFLLLALSLGVDPSFTVVNRCPEFTVVNRVPAAKPSPTLRVTRVADPSSHVHRCPSCGTEWSHANSSAGDTAKHTCPTCHKVLPAPWWPSERGVRLKNQVVAYCDVLEAVRAGETITVAVGIDQEADCMIDQIPDTEPGLWRCYLRDGEPVMERVTAPPVVTYQNVMTLSGIR